MAENRVAIEDINNHQVAVSTDGRFLTTTVPESYQFYFHALIDAPGVVAANNFMSVFNPVGSGKTVVFFQAEIQNYSTGASTTAVSMTATRITAASGGTQVAAANVNRFVTAWANPVAEVRVGNPTVTTTGVPLNGWAPPISIGVGVGATAQTTAPGPGFVCTPGQGIVFATASGNTSQVWKVLPIWAEF